MPEPAALLESLRRIANEAFALAVLWHALIAAGAVVVLRGRRPTQQRTALLLTLPLASVSGVAFAFGNPFNGIVTALLAVALAVAAMGMPQAIVRTGPLWSAGVGAALVVLGFFYPEFLDKPGIAYVFGAPLGLLPCPTLLFLTGATLVLLEDAPRSWSLPLAAAGLFYGLFGAARLGVGLDALLALGALVLGVSALLPAKPGLPRRRPAG